MRRIALLPIALGLLACVPHAVPLEPAQRADAAERLQIGAFAITPPAGRWAAEPVEGERALGAAEPQLLGLLASLALPEGHGTRLCKLTRVRWETAGGGATEPREHCAWLQPFRLTASEPRAASARELADRLAPRARAIEVDYVGEPDFWRGVKWFDARGAAGLLRAGANELVDLHLVARGEPTRVLRAGGRVLLRLGPGDAHLAVVVEDAADVTPGSELWRVLASITPAAP
jgi:hypothetical protein